MNAVEKALMENIDNPASLFVFPTNVAASRWADRLLRLRRGGTVAMEKFIAWDTFKQNLIRGRVQGKKSIPAVLRKMFVSALIHENAQLCAKGEPPVFTSLIRTQWAGQADSSVNWIAGILPQLGIWFRQAAGKSIEHIGDALPQKFSSGSDNLDLFNLALRYSQFLEMHKLFEPAWETPPFEDTGKECFIFFSDSLTDFSEYRDLLEASSHVKVINADISETVEQAKDVFFYTNSRSEITEAALYIQALHDNANISWESISVSIPDAEYYGPYLFREFENRNIPYINQSGTPLASYPPGKFFAALAACASSDFSFASLTELLLNHHLPWKNSNIIRDLINFGINNNCICSWGEASETESDKETLVNVWEDAFAHPYGGIAPETRKFFADIKRQTNYLCHAASFSEIRKQYFIFRNYFFDMDNCLEETNTILARCISELMYLVEIEKSFPALLVPNPYMFFTSYLEETSYLAQQKSSGVAILPYRTAAPAPFDSHIVLGASQQTLTAVFSPLAFLSRNRREKLGLVDEDASKTFITLHQFNSRLPAAFFCSEQTFSGYAIPHSALQAAEKPKQRFGNDPLHEGKFAPDLYRAESKFYASLSFPLRDNKQAELQMPGKIHKQQKQGFEEWHGRRKRSVETATASAKEFSTTAQGEASAVHPLMQMIQRRFGGKNDFQDKVGVSSSSLGPYFLCPHIWLFNRILDLENVEIETRLMAGSIAGDVYHTVLSLFLEELKKTGGFIAPPLDSGSGKNSAPRLSELYSALLKKNIDTVFESFPNLPGSKQKMSMLTARLLHAQQGLFYYHLENFLAAFVSFFHGSRVVATETMYAHQKDFYFLNGRLDCILEDNRDNKSNSKPLIIVDFKTKNMPSLSDYTGEEGLVDFQLPMYLRLAEAANKKEVHTALFFSIQEAEPMVLFGSIKDTISGGSFPKKEKNIIPRGSDNYEHIMSEFDEKAEMFAAEISINDISRASFSLYPEYRDNCPDCGYNKVCRTLYKICQGNNTGK